MRVSERLAYVKKKSKIPCDKSAALRNCHVGTIRIKLCPPPTRKGFAVAATDLLELSSSDRETLETWLVEFDTAWQEDALATWVAHKLPQLDPRLRRAALAELVKVDLEQQWTRGRRLSLGSYLERFPDLGTAQTVAADLIFAEVQVRQQFGEPSDLTELARRYPRQAAELSRLIHGDLGVQSLAPLSFEPPPASAPDRDTSQLRAATDTAVQAARGEAPDANVRGSSPDDARRGSPEVARRGSPDPAETPDRQVSPAAEDQPDPEDSKPPRELPKKFGRYSILKPLGKGGMGAVYLAYDTQLERRVALKVPNFSAHEQREVVERFLREARAMATIRHAHLCPVFDAGVIDGTHYLTMAYIEGHLLSEFIKPGEPASQRRAAALVRKLALALQEAHANGIVHRDLKPQNIFIDQRGEPVVVDFGLARRGVAREATLTQSGALMGTPAYMAPEQARGRIESVGPHSDVYSLGVILYQLLTGRLPYQGDFLAVLGQVMSAEEPDPPRTHQPDLDQQLETICLKAMAKRSADRYASMADLAQALTDLLKSRQLDERAGRGTSGLAGRGVPDTAGRGSPVGRGAPDFAGRGSPDPALAADRQVSSPVADEAAWPAAPTLVDAQGVSGRPTVGQVARSGDRPQRAGDRPQRAGPRVPPWAWIATACGAAAVLLGVIFYLQTNHGLVKIELSDPAAKVQVQVDGETIAVTGLDRPLRLRPGAHGLVVTGDDFETVTRSFTVKRGSDEPLRVTLIPKAGPVAQTPPAEPQPSAPPPAPQPAVYQVQITPPEALLTASGRGVTVAGAGGTRTVTVAEPDGQTKVVLLAVLAGHENQQRELQPTAGESQTLAIQLSRSPAPVAPPPVAPPPSTVAKTPEPAPKLPPAPAGPLPTITNSIDMRLVQIPAGEFLMGSPDSDNEASSDEKPQHRVRITQPFYLGAFEVTQSQYQQVLGSNPSHFKDESGLSPVDSVSWEDAQEFCAKLSELPPEKQAGRQYRLPSEAEWEYACRAGSTSRYGFDESRESLGSYAWYDSNSGSKTHPVGQKKPNARGLYDMHGNVYEWCFDWWNGTYDASSVDDPRGPTAGSYRVYRGGSWDFDAGYCRSAYRLRYTPGYRNRNVGFRVALSSVDATSK